MVSVVKSVYEYLIVGLIVASIVLVVLDYVVSLGVVRGLVYLADFAICILLALDYVYRMIHSGDKLGFVKKYWYELLASIPAYIFLTIQTQFLGAAFRSLRIIRAVRMMRVVRLSLILFKVVRLMEAIGRLLIRSKVVYLLALALMVIVFSSTAIYVAESGLESSSLRTFFDAIWWSFTTVTTVGYGDIVPITMEGKVIGITLMIFGITVWSGIISLLTAAIVEKRYEERTSLKRELRSIVKKYIDKSNQLTYEERKLLQKLLELIMER